MSHRFEEVTVNLMNEKVQFTGISKSNPEHPVSFDYRAPLGDGRGFNGLELLLMSFAGCSGTTIVYLLRNMGKTISGMEVNARGLRCDRPPVKFDKIFIEFILNSRDAIDADVEKAIDLAGESVCPVWQMIKNNVSVIPEYKIITG